MRRPGPLDRAPLDPAPLDRARATLRPHLLVLSRRRPWIYWSDLLLTAAFAWASLATGAALAGGLGPALPGVARLALAPGLFVIAVLALYRASAFMHEVAHVSRAMPGYALAWDVLIGVPLLLPSILYVGVHTTHHARAVFGTDADPEYVKLDGTGHRVHLAMLLRFALVPLALLVRWGVLAPLSFAAARLGAGALRRFLVERLSSFAGNPAYRRPLPTGRDARSWARREGACCVFSLAGLGLLASGVVPLGAICFAAAVATCVSVLHGARSFATHRFHGAGAPRTVDEQFLDSVNVTGHPLLTELWAPAGLRYHALHHLVPRLPYHSLGAAHRLLLAALPPDDPYRSVTFPGLRAVFVHVVAAADGEPSSAPRAGAAPEVVA